jgi:superfamily I DNA/RNA helicase
VAALLGTTHDERFTHVVADEVQDFGYADLCFLRALAAEGPDDLFLCGDPGQRIFKMRSSWSAAGVNVRGRSTRLRVNYRTTEQIRRFASGFLDESIEDSDGEVEIRETISLLSGIDPEVQSFRSVDEEIEGVAAWLRSLLSQGYSPRDIAIFGRIDAVLADRAQPALEACGLEWVRLRDDQTLAEGCAAVGTMHRAKGLEFKLVVVMGCEKGLVPLSVAIRDHADPADRETALEQEKNLVYVACTRARERVLLTHSGTRSDLIPKVTTD